MTECQHSEGWEMRRLAQPRRNLRIRPCFVMEALQGWPGSGLQVSQGGGFQVQGKLGAASEGRGEQTQHRAEASCGENMRIWVPGGSRSL